MGFFRRLRAGSTTNADPEASSSPHASSSQSRSTSPGPSTHSSQHTPRSQAYSSSSPASTLYTQTSPRLSSDVLARPIRPGVIASSSSSSIVDKLGKKTWRRKTKPADPIAGPSYESTPPRSGLGEPLDLRQRHDIAASQDHRDASHAAAVATRGGGKRDTMVFLGHQAGSGSGLSVSTPAPRSLSFAGSPTSTWGRSDGSIVSGSEALDITPKKERGKRRGSRVSTGEFEQEGGILGKLGFEGRVKSRENSWIDVRVSPGVSPNLPKTEKEGMPNVFETPFKQAIAPKSDGDSVPQGGVENEGAGYNDGDLNKARPSDEIEVLESAEKKQKFWKGIRSRRASRAASDIEDEEPGSPTPRKATMPQSMMDAAQSPAARSSIDVAQPRPQQIRRPSSSLFHNPFARTLSRSSIHELDIASSPADDGSFQLKSFRHISGTTDVEGLGGLEDYLSHVPRGSMMALDEPKALATPEPANPVNPPPSAFTPGPRPRAPSRNQLSRPPSVAASLASMDDMVTPNKISAAAFRKGIRRPSEGPTTVNADARADGDDDDEDDDVPLGMISKHKIRDQSALSLSSMKDTPAKESEKPVPPTQAPAPVPASVGSIVPPGVIASPPPEAEVTKGKSKSATPSPRPSPTPSPALSAKSGKHTRNAPSFVVKGRENRPGHDRRVSGDAISLMSLPRSASRSPLPSRASPAPPTPPARDPPPIDTSAKMLDHAEIVDSPPPLTASEAQPHFPLIAPAPISGSRQTSAPWFEVAAGQTKEHENASSSARTSPARPPPPVEPVELPQRGNTSPSISLDDLPLPPDQMPDTPPKSTTPLSPSSTAEVNPPRARTMSMLEEPFRVISGFWGSANDETKAGNNRESKESLDRDLVLSSMAMYADEDEVARPDAKPVAPAVYIPATNPISPSEEKVRSPIELRLAAAAAARASAHAKPPQAVSTSSLHAPVPAQTTEPAASWIPNDISMNSLSRLIDSDPDEDQAEATTTPAARAPTVPTTPEEKEASAKPSPEIESSFARARPVQPRSSSAKLHVQRPSRDSSIPTLSTLIAEERRRDTIIAAAEQPRPRSVSRPESSHSAGRATPDNGSSFSRTPRLAQRASVSQLGSSAESDESEVDVKPDKGKDKSKSSSKEKGKGKSIFTRGRQHPVGPRHSKNPALSAAVKDDSSSSSEDESLSVLRARASRSTLSVHKSLSPDSRPTSIPVSPARSAKSTASPLNPQANLPASTSRSKTRTESSSSSRPNVSPRKSSKTIGLTSSTSSPILASKSIPNLTGARGRSPKKADMRLQKADAKASGSPESSSQSATSESLAQHPMTPRDANAALQRTSVMDPSGPQWRSEPARDRRHSQLPLTGGVPHAPGGFLFDPQMPMPQPGMDQAAMLSMMKQAWQAQFMAAAYRASEDEWERASAVSGQTNGTQVPPNFPPFGGMGQVQMQMQMGQMPYGYPSPMGQMPGWPMQGMGVPGMPMPMPGMGGMGGMGGMPWVPPYAGSSSGQSLVSQHTGGGGSGLAPGGMYGYGSGTQSVFGGEFGPPQQTHPRSSFYSYPSQSTVDLSSYPHALAQHPSMYETGPTAAPGSPPRPAFAKQRTSSSSSQQGPPTAWRQSSYSAYGGAGGSVAGGTEGQWDDVPTPRKSRHASGHMVN